MPWRMGKTIIYRRKTIVDLCGGTGSWSDPWREAGYEVHVVDQDPTLRPDHFLSVQQFGRHLRERTVHLQPVWGVLAAPPCTHFANSGSRNWHLYDEDGRTEQSTHVLRVCLRLIEDLQPAWWALENPPGRIVADILGPPSWSFQPYEYGDAYSKRTLIWGTARKPEPTTPDLKPVAISPGQRLGGASPKTKTLRSMTPRGFAEAFFHANKQKELSHAHG